MQTCHSSSREVGSRDPSESEANLGDAMSQGGEGWKKKKKKKKKNALKFNFMAILSLFSKAVTPWCESE